MTHGDDSRRPADPAGPSGGGADGPAAGGFDGPAHRRERVTLDPAARAIEEKVVEQLRACYDPEIPVNIFELGLIYTIDVTPNGEVAIRMTLTSPACPVAGSLPGDVEARLRAVPGVAGVRVDVTWEPPWGPEMMTDAAKLQLNML